jgi:hypothetical protein
MFLAPDFDPITNIKKHIEESVNKFGMGRATVGKMLKQAEENEARERLRAQKSLPNGVGEEKEHPYVTQARFRPLRRLGKGLFRPSR